MGRPLYAYKRPLIQCNTPWIPLRDNRVVLHQLIPGGAVQTTAGPMERVQIRALSSIAAADPATEIAALVGHLPSVGTGHVLFDWRGAYWVTATIGPGGLEWYTRDTTCCTGRTYRRTPHGSASGMRIAYTQSPSSPMYKLQPPLPPPVYVLAPDPIIKSARVVQRLAVTTDHGELPCIVTSDVIVAPEDPGSGDDLVLFLLDQKLEPVTFWQERFWVPVNVEQPVRLARWLRSLRDVPAWRLYAVLWEVQVDRPAAVTPSTPT